MIRFVNRVIISHNDLNIYSRSIGLGRAQASPYEDAFHASSLDNEHYNMTINSTKPHIQRIWLVRHGPTTWNVQQRFCGTTDIPLSPIGRRQARHIASQLRARPIVAIYSSDLLRAKETAEIIVQKINGKGGRKTAKVSPTPNNLHIGKTLAVSLPHPTISSRVVVASPVWREIAFGAWEGLTYNEIATTFPDQLGFFTDPEHIAPPEGETLHDVLQRVYPVLLAIVQQGHSGEIVIVSHGGILRGLLCSLLGMPLRNQWQLHIDTGSLSVIDVSLDEHGGLLASLVGLNVQQ